MTRSPIELSAGQLKICQYLAIFEKLSDTKFLSMTQDYEGIYLAIFEKLSDSKFFSKTRDHEGKYLAKFEKSSDAIF